MGERKKAGSLMMRDLDDVITAENCPEITQSQNFFPNTEYLATLVVVVPKNAEKDFLEKYEGLCSDLVESEGGTMSPVVPDSAVKLMEQDTPVCTKFRCFGVNTSLVSTMTRMVPSTKAVTLIMWSCLSRLPVTTGSLPGALLSTLLPRLPTSATHSSCQNVVTAPRPIFCAGAVSTSERHLPHGFTLRLSVLSWSQCCAMACQ